MEVAATHDARVRYIYILHIERVVCSPLVDKPVISRQLSFCLDWWSGPAQNSFDMCARQFCGYTYIAAIVYLLSVIVARSFLTFGRSEHRDSDSDGIVWGCVARTHMREPMKRAITHVGMPGPSGTGDPCWREAESETRSH